MVQQSPPIKAAGHTFYIGLPSVASSGAFQDGPTLATGDFKISKDGGALANLATLPTATGKMVEIVLSASEMDADNIVIIASDAAGAEWGDVLTNIQTEAGQLGFLTDGIIDANIKRLNGGGTGVTNMSTIFVSDFATNYANNKWQTEADLSGLNDISPAEVTAAVPTTAEIEAALINEGDGQQLIDAILQVINSSLDLPALELTAIAQAVRTELATELGRLDVAITTRLSTAGYTAPANSDIIAIKAKTDDLTFTKANELDANIKSVNDVGVTGDGETGTEWGPV